MQLSKGPTVSFWPLLTLKLRHCKTDSTTAAEAAEQPLPRKRDLVLGTVRILNCSIPGVWLCNTFKALPGLFGTACYLFVL